MQTEGLPVGVTKQGVFVTGRLNDFDLKGESGTKCPNLTSVCLPARMPAARRAVGKLDPPNCVVSPIPCVPCSIGQADVTADVFVRFVFQYDK